MLGGEFHFDHEGLAAQLSMAGRRLNLLPSPNLLPRHQQLLDAFARERDGRKSLLLMRQVHQDSMGLHAVYAELGKSPTLRMVARNALRVERAHVEALRLTYG
jgi:putative membrane protein